MLANLQLNVKSITDGRNEFNFANGINYNNGINKHLKNHLHKSSCI